MIRKLLCSAIILFFTTQSILFAQNKTGIGGTISTTSTSSTPTQPNRQYFLVRSVPGSLKGLSAQLKPAFTVPHFIAVEIDEKTSILKIIANKGTKIEDVKAILVSFNLGIIDYSEEYTNSFPSIFSNY
ncbi:MAG: hypothetical protein IPI10_02820 [Bacteroidetes bacterium]|nr:hypothetical protein [Bacteroidota bacterium]MBK7429701.1 hypothetical protein [Bacteroidota bacterium]MBK7570587.1 hypothetical protein [Bacteroidota bacterium]MBP9790037.1 hypothetical protein [Bacteroidia bacterium]